MKNFLLMVLFGILSSFASANQLGEKIKLKSIHLGEEREIVVSLPPIYDSEPFYKFPVMYLTDAYSQFDHTASMVHYFSGEFSPMIVVGIYTQDRLNELKPYTAEKQPNPKAEQLRKFIVEEVKAYVEKNYRTETFSIFAGHSLGGSFATHAYLKGPNDFNVFLAFAPNFAMGNEVMFDLMPAAFAQHKQPNMYFQFEGITPFPTPIKSYHKISSMLLDAPHLKGSHSVQLLNGEDHMSVTHVGLISAFKEIYRDWFLYIHPVLADKNAFTAHYKMLSERVGYTVKPTESNLWEFVTILIEQNKLGTAQFIADKAIEMYPKSHFSYSLLADVALARNENMIAVKHLNQAIELAAGDVERVTRYRRRIEKLNG
ncbi:alpha/beta hydrolase-fold protein [Thalassotalea euphylliae]|uniref:alpha/beta hydrolase-fold protein n=1 Tax=Thalassotalea euphylliae TaxID=1655234 RepID=UPI00363CEF9E